jgi:cbb3-type cytochrome oxidase subunit 1
MLAWMFTDEPWSPPRRFLYLGVAWGVLAVLTEFAASLHLVAPGALSDVAWLGYGRLVSAARDLWIYGFTSNLLLAALVALVPQIARAPLTSVRLVNLSVWLWNAAQAVAWTSLLAGVSRGRLWGEAPWTADLLRLGAALLLLWILVRTTAGGRRNDPVVGLGIAALGWFGAVLLLGKGLFTPGGNPYWGITDALAQAFLRQGLSWLWLFPAASAAWIGLSGAVAGQSAPSVLATLILLTTGAFGSFSAGAEFVWGPVPFWAQTVGAVSSMLLLLPAAGAVASLWGVARARPACLFEGPALAFFLVGGASFVFASLAGGLEALLGPARVAGLTLWTEARTVLLLAAGAGSVGMGAVYALMPAAIGRILASPRLAWWHFWIWTLGCLVSTVALMAAGISQGAIWATGTVPFASSVQATVPYLVARCAALGAMVLGQMMFSWNVFLTADSGVEVPAAQRELVLAT